MLFSVRRCGWYGLRRRAFFRRRLPCYIFLALYAVRSLWLRTQRASPDVRIGPTP